MKPKDDPRPIKSLKTNAELNWRVAAKQRTEKAQAMIASDNTFFKPNLSKMMPTGICIAPYTPW